MGSRFHNKFHRQSHHTNPTAGNADSANDPIASPSDPFQGDFVVNGEISALGLSVNTLSATEIHAVSAYIHYQDLIVSELSGFVVNGTTSDLSIPVSVVPGDNNITLNQVGLTSTNWATFDGDLQTKRDLYVTNRANISGTLDMHGNSIVNVASASITFDNGVSFGSQKINNYDSVYSSVNSTSGNWDSVYSSVNSTSGNWDSVFTSVNSTSGNWDSVFTSVNSTSGNWDSAYSSVTATSGNWDGVWTTVNSTSGNWDSVFTSVNSTSGLWDSTRTIVNSNSADWNSVYSSVNATSGLWDSTRTTVNSTSGLWGSVYSSVNATSGLWDSARTTVNSNSALWTGTQTVVNNTSANWNGVWTTVNSNSATNWDNIGLASESWVQTNFVNTSGDIMTGNLSVAGDISASGDVYSSGEFNLGANTAIIYTDGSDNLVLSSVADIIFAPVDGGIITIGEAASSKGIIYSNSNNLVISAVGNVDMYHNTTVHGSLSSSNYLGLPAYASIKRPNVVVSSADSPYIVNVNQSTTTFVVSTQDDGNIEFHLPGVTVNDLGTYYSFVKFATGTAITVSALNASIDDSDLNATIYSGTSATSGQQAFASIELELVLPAQWHVRYGRKTWTTTQFI